MSAENGQEGETSVTPFLFRGTRDLRSPLARAYRDEIVKGDIASPSDEYVMSMLERLHVPGVRGSVPGRITDGEIDGARFVGYDAETDRVVLRIGDTKVPGLWMTVPLCVSQVLEARRIMAG